MLRVGGTVLLKRLGASMVFLCFVFLLPFFGLAILIPGMPEDDRWFLKAAFTFLSPFSAVLWFIVFSHLVLRRRAGYFMQVLVFFGAVALICLLLRAGVYRL